MPEDRPSSVGEPSRMVRAARGLPTLSSSPVKPFSSRAWMVCNKLCDVVDASCRRELHPWPLKTDMPLDGRLRDSKIEFAPQRLWRRGHAEDVSWSGRSAVNGHTEEYLARSPSGKIQPRPLELEEMPLPGKHPQGRDRRQWYLPIKKPVDDLRVTG